MREERATAIVFGLVNPALKMFLISWMVALSFAAFALAGYFGLRETRSYTEEIQESRKQFVLDNCRDRNKRHDATIRRLAVNVDAIPPGERRQDALAGREGTIALIDAAIPKRDCNDEIERLEVGGEP